MTSNEANYTGKGQSLDANESMEIIVIRRLVTDSGLPLPSMLGGGRAYNYGRDSDCAMNVDLGEIETDSKQIRNYGFPFVRDARARSHHDDDDPSPRLPVLGEGQVK